jgi:hypothetical protein
MNVVTFNSDSFETFIKNCSEILHIDSAQLNQSEWENYFIRGRPPEEAVSDFIRSTLENTPQPRLDYTETDK